VNRLRRALADRRTWAALAVVAGACGVAVAPELRDALAALAAALLQ
jgi:hypothetical protein